MSGGTPGAGSSPGTSPAPSVSRGAETPPLRHRRRENAPGRGVRRGQPGLPGGGGVSKKSSQPRMFSGINLTSIVFSQNDSMIQRDSINHNSRSSLHRRNSDTTLSAPPQVCYCVRRVILIPMYGVRHMILVTAYGVRRVILITSIRCII